MQSVWVQSLVGERRSQVIHNQKNKNRGGKTISGPWVRSIYLYLDLSYFDNGVKETLTSNQIHLLSLCMCVSCLWTHSIPGMSPGRHPSHAVLCCA